MHELKNCSHDWDARDDAEEDLHDFGDADDPHEVAESPVIGEDGRFNRVADSPGSIPKANEWWQVCHQDQAQDP